MTWEMDTKVKLGPSFEVVAIWEMSAQSKLIGVPLIGFDNNGILIIFLGHICIELFD